MPENKQTQKPGETFYAWSTHLGVSGFGLEYKNSLPANTQYLVSSIRARTGAKRERHVAMIATTSTRCKLRMTMAVLELFPAIATDTGKTKIPDGIRDVKIPKTSKKPTEIWLVFPDS